MPKAISSASISELSLVFAKRDGLDWEPRNQDARIITVKASAKKPSFIERLLAKAGFPVSVDVKDDVDNDGDDGSDDYNQICQSVCALYYDLQCAMQMQDENTRSIAIKTALDGFKTDYDAIYAGDDEESDEKAGARHSAADKASIDAIGDHAMKAQGMADKLKTHVDAMVAAHGKLTSGKDTTAGEDADNSTDGTVDDANQAKRESDKVAGKAASVDPADKAAKDDKKPEGDYGAHSDAGYADPGLQADKKPRYPLKDGGKLDEKRVRAAWSYINQEKNADAYSSGDLAKIKATIMAACKSLGIEISDDKAAPVTQHSTTEAQPAAVGVNITDAPAEPVLAAEPTNKAGDRAEEEVDMTPEQISAMIADAANKGAEAAMTKAQAQIDALKTEQQKHAEASAMFAESQKAAIAALQTKAAVSEAEVIAARSEADAAKAEAEAAKAAAKAVGVNAQKPSATSYTAPENGEESRLSKAMRAAFVVNPQSHSF